MESFEKRKRERKKQEQRKEKAARKLQGLPPTGPSEADYFADLNAEPDSAPQEGEDTDPAKAPPAIDGGAGS